MVSNDAEIINTGDIFDRVEDLRKAITAANEDELPAEREELTKLEAFLAELVGIGHECEYQGYWYPLISIHQSYFEEYAKDMAEETGMISGTEEWPLNCIDWTKAADELRIDYTAVDFDGQTYWTR